MSDAQQIDNVVKQVEKLSLEPSATTPSAVSAVEGKETEEEMTVSLNNIIFGTRRCMEYLSIDAMFEISVPNHNQFFVTWLMRLLSVLRDADFENEVSSYEWMVLIHPSLQLLREDPKWRDQANEVLHRFREHVVYLSESHGLVTLNDELICLELCGENETPQSVWSNINEYLRPVSSLNDLIDILLSKKDAKKFRVFTSKFEDETKEVKITKSNVSKYREFWGACTNVITQLARLYRVTVQHSSFLEDEIIQNIESWCDEFERRYQTGISSAVRRMMELSDSVKLDYAFTRYKTLMIATHTQTTIPPTFAGMWGKISQEQEFELDWSTWDLCFEGLAKNVDQFCGMVNGIVGETVGNENVSSPGNKKKRKKRKTKSVSRLTAFETQSLRGLDNISYVSCCLYLGAAGVGSGNLATERMDKLKSLRERMTDKILLCFENRLILSEYSEIESLAEANVFLDRFLTYDKYDKLKWMLHLMAGIFLNFWTEKNE